MATELAGIRRAIRDPDRRGVTLHVTGVGKQRTLDSFGGVMAASPQSVIMVGFCGAADPALRTGDLHVATRFCDSSAAQSYPIDADADLASAAIAAATQCGAHVVTGPSATVSAMADVAAKSAVRASMDAASVNMEDYWAASAARSFPVPFASIRVVLDTADEELPAWLAAAVDNPPRVALGLAAHPRSAPGVLRLARQANLARRNLTRCVVGVIDTLTARQSELTAVAS